MENMTNDTWAYCPDRQGTCGLLIANAERMERDAARIAELGAEIDRINAECNAWSNRAKIAEADLDLTRRNMQRELRDAERIAEIGEELQRAREEVQRLMALHDSWVEAARVLREEVRDVDTKRSRLLADCRDLERENASLRRRLAVGGR